MPTRTTDNIHGRRYHTNHYPALHTLNMDTLFSDRISDVPQSFIREILKVTLDPSIISFAGGLPNRNLFPVNELKKAANTVFEEAGMDALQYASSEGFLPLREIISKRYLEKQQLEVRPEDILITTGSQQGLDLLGKTLINSGDDIIIEEPGYLGAIQAFSIYRPKFNAIPVSAEGMDIEKLVATLSSSAPKLFYSVPNFQNPSGISYSEENRKRVAELIKETRCILIQDDPYGELRFSGNQKSNFLSLAPDNTVLLGSFSKTVAPALRLGWLVAPPGLMEKILVAKQAADLHTNYLAQRILYQYLIENDLDDHINTIISAYGSQKKAMVESIKKHFPNSVSSTDPEGGMFLWVTLPENASAMELFHEAVKQKVVFVPGTPFYVDKSDINTLRLNFSCMDIPTIAEGIERLGQAICSKLEKV